MRILFDQGTPVPLRRLLPEHSVETAYERHWQELENGELLAAAEKEEFDLLLTTDQNLRYQQNLQGRKIGVIVLLSTSCRESVNSQKRFEQKSRRSFPDRTLRFQYPSS